MKKLILSIVAVMLTAVCAFALPKAIYIKKDGAYTKYNFGVAGNLKFTDGGKKLTITGYSEAIDLENVEYITFTAPVDETALTPSAQKNKLIEIGEKADAMVDIDDNAELVRMAYTFTKGGWDDNWDHYETPICEYEIPEEYWNVHKHADEALEAAKLIAKGNPSAARVLRAAAVDLYKAQDYFGIYEANTEKEEWVKIADADYLEIRFKAADADNYVVKLVVSEAYNTWNIPEANTQIPEKMTITFSKGNTELAKGVVDIKMVQDQSIDMDVDFNANGYVAQSTMKVVNDYIDDIATVTIKGQYFCKAVAHIAGKNLVDTDAMHPAIKECFHYHDENDNCCGEDPTELFTHIIRANTDVDILHELQIKGKVFGLSKLYDALCEDAWYDEVYFEDGSRIWVTGKLDNSDPENIRIENESKQVHENHIKFLNNYTDVSLYYDGEEQLQGFLGWDISEDGYDAEWDGVFINIDGYLLNVQYDADWIYDEESGEYKEDIKGYYYYKSVPSTEHDWYDSVRVDVDAEDVITLHGWREVYYDTMPMLIFPDLTSFAFEDFFDEDSFSKIVDDYNEIIDSYYDITGQERPSDDDDYYVGGDDDDFGI